MARVTVEDCIDKVESRYELVVLAARRAKDIASGAPITLSRDNDKDAVVSLREIADETIDLDKIREDVVQSFQHRHVIERLTEAESQEEKQKSLKDEVSAAFAENTINDAEEEATSDDGSMSFAGDNVDVED